MKAFLKDLFLWFFGHDYHIRLTVSDCADNAIFVMDVFVRALTLQAAGSNFRSIVEKHVPAHICGNERYVNKVDVIK